MCPQNYKCENFLPYEIIHSVNNEILTGIYCELDSTLTYVLFAFGFDIFISAMIVNPLSVQEPCCLPRIFGMFSQSS